MTARSRSGWKPEPAPWLRCCAGWSYNVVMSETAATGATRAPNPVLAVLGRLLEGVLDHAIELDPETRQRLAALEGRAVQLRFRGAGLAMRLVVDGGRLRVGPADAAASALSISATPGSLLTMLLRRGDDNALPPGAVDISGDAELARRLEQIATRYAPDIDEAFARTFGDVLGFQLARQFRRAFSASRRAASALAIDTVEYLREESRDVVGRHELEDFLDDVDRIREHGDRMDARVRRLAARIGGSAA